MHRVAFQVGLFMKNYIPGRVDLLVFFAMAVICAIIARLSPYTDYALGLLGMPVFLVAAFLGNRRRVLRTEQVVQEMGESDPAI